MKSDTLIKESKAKNIINIFNKKYLLDISERGKLAILEECLWKFSKIKDKGKSFESYSKEINYFKFIVKNTMIGFLNREIPYVSFRNKDLGTFVFFTDMNKVERDQVSDILEKKENLILGDKISRDSNLESRRSEKGRDIEKIIKFIKRYENETARKKTKRIYLRFGKNGIDLLAHSLLKNRRSIYNKRKEGGMKISIGELNYLKKKGFNMEEKNIDELEFTSSFREHIQEWIDTEFPAVFDYGNRECFSIGFEKRKEECQNCFINEECARAVNIMKKEKGEELLKEADKEEVKEKPKMAKEKKVKVKDFRETFLKDIGSIFTVEEKGPWIRVSHVSIPTLWVLLRKDGLISVRIGKTRTPFREKIKKSGIKNEIKKNNVMSAQMSLDMFKKVFFAK